MASATRPTARPPAAGPLRGVLAGRPPGMRAAIGFGLLCAALVVGLRVWLEWVGPFPGDLWVRRNHGWLWGQNVALVDLGTFFSVIGAPAIAALTVALGTVYAMRAEGPRAGAFVVLAASGVVVNAALKALSGPTPLMVALAGEGNTSLNYPSGHTVYAVVTFGALALLARRARRTDVALPLLGLVLLMGPFRVIATAHFVSDVIAGYLVGAAWLLVAAALTLSPVQARGRR